MSKGLEEIKTLRGFNKVELNNDKNINKSLDTIEKELKALEITKKFIWVENDKLMCGRYADIEIELDEEDFENKEEFDLLKEMIK